MALWEDVTNILFACFNLTESSLKRSKHEVSQMEYLLYHMQKVFKRIQ